MKKPPVSRNLIVTGDVTVDWNIANLEGGAQSWTAREDTTVFCQPGGAAMLADLINSVSKNLEREKRIRFIVRQADPFPKHVSPADDRFYHSYAVWKPFKLDERKPELGNVWRVQEFLGISTAPTPVILKDKFKNRPDIPAPDVIVLDDAALGFRNNAEQWPESLLDKTARPWILVKMDLPIAQGKLWEQLNQYHADRLIVVILARDLRSSQVQISHQLSWERTAQDLVWELFYNPHVNKLVQCRHVVVSFGTSGAILLSKNPESSPEAILFFDPYAMEGEWERYHKGYIIGKNTCLTAGIARELIINSSQPDIAHGIQTGTRAMRTLHMEGYGKATDNLKQTQFGFPVSKIAEIYEEKDECLATAAIENPAKSAFSPRSAHFWTILEDKNPGSLETIAGQIVLEGLENALPEVPVAQFGDLKIVDRKEIESIYSISTLIRDYHKRYHQIPLSIAVFGPPGSGKSFAVKEVARTILPNEIKPLTFNLSQFSGPEDLIDAFHQVRDIVLSGKIPLVFWDEFDTQLQGQPLGWLRYFLAPMQDGVFQEGQLSHPIGRSIFVFAGGTYHSMDTFGANLSENERRITKLPDFTSRIRGFINILGPNVQDDTSQREAPDPYYVIRRATILRSVIERFAPQLLAKDGKRKIAGIDPGILHAFLRVKEYRHGSRSIEAIAAMSQLADKYYFERSCLPSEDQLNLHVDGLDFLSKIQNIELNDDTVERLAEAVHEIFCESLREKGYKYGPVNNKSKLEHSSLLPFSELPEDEKEQNRNNVRDIANKLAMIGAFIIPARGNDIPYEFTKEEIEKLAEEEHNRWMTQKLAGGWKYSKRSNKSRKLHKDLVPWEKLPESEREKDRIFIISIPKILAKAGYIMIR